MRFTVPLQRGIVVIMREKQLAVLAHGFGQNSLFMRNLCKGILACGMDVFSPNLPTLLGSLHTCVEKFNIRISKKLSLYDRVNFVGYSMGGLIARKFINEYRPANIGRCVFIATPHLGSRVADAAGKIPFAADIMKSIPDLQSKESNEYLLDKKIAIGLIIGKKKTIVGKCFLPDINDGMVDAASALSRDAREVCVLNHAHHSIFWSKETVLLTREFLLHGTFRNVQSSCPVTIFDADNVHDVLRHG
jgi:esterase/lipase